MATAGGRRGSLRAAFTQERRAGRRPGRRGRLRRHGRRVRRPVVQDAVRHLRHHRRHAVHGRPRHLLDVPAQPGVRLVRAPVVLGHGHARAAAVRARTGPAAGVPPDAGAVAPDDQPHHHGADGGARAALRRGTRPLRDPARLGGPPLVGLRRHLRPRLVRLGDRPHRHPDRAGRAVPRHPPGLALLRAAPLRRDRLAAPAPPDGRRVRAGRLAHPAVRDQRLVRGVAADGALAAATARRRPAAGPAAAARAARRAPRAARPGRPGRAARRGGRCGPAAWLRPPPRPPGSPPRPPATTAGGPGRPRRRPGRSPRRRRRTFTNRAEPAGT